jgi:hypothetical protein
MNDDDARQLRLLRSPLGLPGSGRLRYGAAMHFAAAGRIGPAVLEAFRVASASDRADPRQVLAERHLSCDLLDGGAGPDPVGAIAWLVDEIDRYLATLPGPGVAEVRQGLARWRGGPVTAAARAPNAVRDAWLAPALTQVAETEPGLAAAIAAAAPALGWITYDLYPPAEIGADFGRGHAYCSILGAEASVPAQDYDLGLFLIAPHVLYRDHCHPAPELYAPLTGPHGWRFAPGAPLVVKAAHEPVWNEPLRPHMTKVGPNPFLCIFGWTRDVLAPARVIAADDWPALERLRLQA